MSKKELNEMTLEEFFETLDKEELEYLESVLFDENGNLISYEKFKEIHKQELTMEEQLDALQYALKINLNSVYGVSIMPYFKFSDEWQSLGASTTLTGRILSKYGLIETIEQYFNPERESRYEFPLLDNVIVAADDDEFYENPLTQKLRRAVISDTDSVTGDSKVVTNKYGEITIEELKKYAIFKQKIDNKIFYFFKNLKILNYINNKITFDNVDFIFEHKNKKQLYKITTQDNKEIIVTEDHSIMVLNENDELIEKKPNELNIGDKVITIKKLKKGLRIV
jgi:DNA polymerase elongation subunit (family B)